MSTGGKASSSARLSKRTTLRADFVARVPGRYTLRLTTGTGRTATSDSVTLSAVPPNPLVTIDTIARPGDKPGIAVGENTYAAAVPAGKPTAFVQVLVLDRKSLGFVSNTTYTNTDQLQAALGQLDLTELVVVAMPTPGAGAAPLGGSKGVLQALAPIGVGNVQGGGGQDAVSAIGVPTMAPGDANVDVDPHGGGMDGYLTRDEQYLNYGFISPQRVPFTFPVLPSGCPPDSHGCDDVGFLVTDIDPYTLKSTSTFFDTNGRSLSDVQRDEQARQMGAHVDAIPAGDLIRIETISNSEPGEGSYRAAVGSIDRETAFNLAAIVAGVGGTRNGFNTAAFSPGPYTGEPRYSLLGWGRAGEGNGEEDAAGAGGASDGPYLSGILRRDRTYRFRPVQTTRTNFGPAPQTLQNLIMQPPTKAWPLDNNPEAHEALAYIGQTSDNRLGCDPRSSYWTQGFGEADVNAIVREVAAATYPGTNAGDPCAPGNNVAFTESQFDTAQNELLQELKWVGRVRSYMTNLSAPFDDNGLKSWARVIEIAADIYDKAKQPDENVGLNWNAFTSIILKLLGPVTGGTSATAAGLLDLGAWIANRHADGSSRADELPFKADQLGAKLVDQAEQAQASYVKMGDIIVSDYAKLSVVGANGGCAPGSPTCNEDFSYTDNDRADLSEALALGVERLAYEKLLPLGFHVFQLNSDPKYVPDHTQPPDPQQYNCPYYPWYYYPSPLAWTSLLQGFDPVHHDNIYDVFVLSIPPGANTYHGTPPDEAMLTRMFDSVSKGGLGMSAATMMRTAEHDGWTGEGPGRDSCTFN